MKRTWIYNVFWSISPLDLWNVLSTIGKVSFYRTEKPIQSENRQTRPSSKGSIGRQWTNLVRVSTEIGEPQGLSGKTDSQLRKFATLAKFLTSWRPEWLIYSIVVKRLASTTISSLHPLPCPYAQFDICLSVACLEADDPPSEVLLEDQ